MHYDKINETLEYIKNRWLTPLNESRKDIIDEDGKAYDHFKGHLDINDNLYLTNDHRHLDFTDEDFKNYTKTMAFVTDKILIDNLRKRR